jgi:basic membrane lipoprotein Med (substrate-binding protein (PBP1-ABC) superfamily)
MVVSCIQQDKTAIGSEMVYLKYRSTETDLSSSQSFYEILSKEAQKNHKSIELKEVESNYVFENEIQQQIKDYGRKYIFIGCKYPEDKLVLLAKQNPAVFFILINELKDYKLNNVKSIGFDRSELAQNLAYVSAYWADTKENGKGGVALLQADNSDWAAYTESFFKGIEQYNQEYGTKITLNKIKVKENQSQEEIERIIDRSIKGNNCLYILSLNNSYFSYLKAIQLSGKYSIGLESDLFYTRPEYQDAILISGMIDYKAIASDLLKSLDNGTLDASAVVADYKNGLISLSSFHNFDNQISEKIKSQLAIR